MLGNVYALAMFEDAAVVVLTGLCVMLTMVHLTVAVILAVWLGTSICVASFGGVKRFDSWAIWAIKVGMSEA